MLERCVQHKLPKPEIVNDGEKLEIKWIWHDVMEMKNPPSKDKYDNEFNPEYDDMQQKLCGLSWNLGVDEKKLQVTTALRVPGTLNTRTNTLVRVAVASEENILYRDMMRLLNGEDITPAVITHTTTIALVTMSLFVISATSTRYSMKRASSALSWVTSTWSYTVCNYALTSFSSSLEEVLSRTSRTYRTW